MRVGDVEFGIELHACKRPPSNCCVYDTCIIKSILGRSCDSLVITLISFRVSQVRVTMAELSHSATGLVDGTGWAVCRGKPGDSPSLQDGSAAPGSVPTDASQLRMGLSPSPQGVLGNV